MRRPYGEYLYEVNNVKRANGTFVSTHQTLPPGWKVGDKQLLEIWMIACDEQYQANARAAVLDEAVRWLSQVATKDAGRAPSR